MTRKSEDPFSHTGWQGNTLAADRTVQGAVIRLTSNSPEAEIIIVTESASERKSLPPRAVVAI